MPARTHHDWSIVKQYDGMQEMQPCSAVLAGLCCSCILLLVERIAPRAAAGILDAGLHT